MTETRITKNVSVTQNIKLRNYSFQHTLTTYSDNILRQHTQHTPTESSSGGTLQYIANQLSYKTRSNLNICKKNWIRIYFYWNSQLPKNLILLLAPFTDIKKWMWQNLTKIYLHFIKIYKEQKTVFLLANFNTDLMHYNEHITINDFLDSFASNSYLLYIIQLSRHRSHSRTLIDNIFQ